MLSVKRSPTAKLPRLCKNAGKKRHGIRKGYEDRNAMKEGETFGYGVLFSI